MTKLDPKREEMFMLLREAERRASRRDLFYLSKNILGAHWLKEGFSALDEQHVELCNNLMWLWRTRRTRAKTYGLVEWPRRTLKSTICTAAFPIWVLLNNPNIRILIDSEVSENARNFLKQIRQFYEGEYIQELFGRQYNPKENWNMDNITLFRSATLPQPSIDTGGIDASKTSQHYDLIISDDLQNKNNCKSKEQRDKVKEHAKLYANLIDPNGMILFVGTRWDFDDLNNMIYAWAKDDEKCLRPKRIFIHHKSCYKYGPDGELTREPQFPKILPQEELDGERASQGAWVFSCNYLVRPQSDETAMFKKEWIQYHNLEESEWSKWTTFITVDPAGEGTNASADLNAIVVSAISPDGNIYVLDYVNARMTRAKLFEKLIELYKKYDPKKIGVEAVFKQIELIPLLKEYARNEGLYLEGKITDFKNSKQQKKHRVQALQQPFEYGHIFIRPSHGELEDQILRFDGTDSSKTKKDDLVDALAYVMQFMTIPKEELPKDYWNKPGWRENYQGEKAPPDESTISMWKWRKERDKKRKKAVARIRRRNAFF